MTNADADVVQARLALRALWSPLKDNGKNTESANEVGKASTFHRALHVEVDEILRTGFKRRLERLQGQVKLLCDANGLKTTENSSRKDVDTSEAPNMSADVEIDEGPLCESAAKALRRAIRCTQPPPKVYGPTATQDAKTEPEEKEEPFVRESQTLQASLECVQQSLSSRTRQIRNLTQQLEVCEKVLKEKTELADEANVRLDTLRNDPSKLQEALQQELQRKRQKSIKLADSAKNAQVQAKYYQKLAHDQRASFLQSERVAASGGRDTISRHPAGDIFLVPQPPAMNDDDGEEVFDVGTHVANPYVCDSWPFEPNVLARRGPQEGSMPPFTEETEEDLEEENKPRNPFRDSLKLRLPVAGGDSDDEDDYAGRYNGPSDTARSL
eukprot:TRINITY_DN9744_c0_g1_i1.p1 TRINITY_DN9744_c0_g1~~TRINITY_DN9744_c0_g1_i1.p1  ORF type:complete len:384 (-),score=82.11 TRINITY_DN9744_c0_g1_i1:51-1202(-)